jgi:ATP-dependent protease ClpP protease subunit
VVGGYDFDRNYVDYVLSRYEDKPVNVLIDSLGGSLATALSIASAFKRHGDVTVHFVGMNASAATVASLGAKHISMDSSAMYLVHKCSAQFFEWGNLNADQLAQLVGHCEDAINDLNKLDNNIAAMYAAKTSKPQADLLNLMKEGGWLNAKEAREWGFVDEITELNEEKPVLTDAVASAMAAAGMPIPNVPTESKETAFARFLASIASLFKSRAEAPVTAAAEDPAAPEGEENETPQTIESTESISNQTKEAVTVMNRSYELLGKVLQVEGFAVGENGVTLTEAQIQAIEDALAARDRQNADLTAQVEALQANPAEDSHAVIDDNSRHEPQTPFDEFVQTVNDAKRLHALVP